MTRKPGNLRQLAAPSFDSDDLSRHLLRAIEEERKRISRELHDETGQGLMVLRLYLGMIADDLRKPASLEKVRQATELLDRTIGDLRRIIARLSPRVLDELGLLSAIRKEARELNKNTGLKPHLYLPENLGQTDHDVEVAIYRTVQEALHNIAKHAQARSFTITIEERKDELTLLIQDDGIGAAQPGKSLHRSFGLRGMKERIAGLGGNLQIRFRSGEGTSLRIVIPLSGRASSRSPKRSLRRQLVPFVRAG